MYNNPYKRVVGAVRPQSNPWNVTGKIERPSNAQMLKTIEAYHTEPNEKKKKEILDQVCKSHLDLMACYANELSHDADEINNLIQEGFVGLVKAVQTFDRSKGASWIIHASWKTKGAMNHYMRDKAAVVRKPAKIYAIENRVRYILQANNTDKSIPDILGSLDVNDRSTIEEYLRYHDSFASILPIDTQNQDGDHIETINDSGATNPNVNYEDCADVDNRILIEQVEKILTRIEFAVLKRYYLDNMSKKKICEELGLKNTGAVNKNLKNALEKAQAFVQM